MHFTQLIARTLASLELNEHEAFSDTLSALVATLLECQARAVLLRGESGELELSASDGCDGDSPLLSPAGRELWAWVLDERVAQSVSRDDLLARWPDAPTCLRRGFACVSIDLRGEPIGVLMVAGRLSREPFGPEELIFLSTVAGLGTMAIANSLAHAEIDSQRRVAQERARVLDGQLATIAEQRDQIAELSAPILPLHPKVLALPLIGSIDAERGEVIQERLLASVAAQGARFVLLDLTGVNAIDAATATYLVRLTRAIALIGGTCFLTGIRPGVARSFVSLAVDLSWMAIMPTLGHGLDECLRRLSRRDETGAGAGRGGAPRRRSPARSVG